MNQIINSIGYTYAGYCPNEDEGYQEENISTISDTSDYHVGRRASSIDGRLHHIDLSMYHGVMRFMKDR